MKTLSLFDGAVEVGISDFDDGNMRYFAGVNEEVDVISAQEKLSEAIGLAGEKVARLNVVYTEDMFVKFSVLSSEKLAEYSVKNSEWKIPAADGIITYEKEVGILLPLADCLGLVIYDTKQKILGLLHAGRHTVEQMGAKKFVEYFISDFKSEPKDLKAWFSPCAQNYQIYALDNKKLPDAVFEQLVSTGVLAENITNSEIDTVTNEKYPSRSNGDIFYRFGIVVKQK